MILMPRRRSLMRTRAISIDAILPVLNWAKIYGGTLSAGVKRLK
jgi:hypothetical protein